MSNRLLRYNLFMNSATTWRTIFEKEILQAESARAAGNEGMARVCARRAAGVVAGEYLRRQGLSLSNPSAYAGLKFLSQIPQTPPTIQEIVDHFLIKIDFNHSLPVRADLIAEARWLANELLSWPN